MRQETPKEKEQRQAKEKKERLERVLRQKIFDATVAKIPDRFTKPDLVFICSAYFAEIWYENQKLLSKRHGLKETRQFGKYIAGLDLMGLNRLLMEMALIRVYASKPFGEKDPLLVVAERYGVSPNAIKKDTDKEKKKPKARVAKSKTPLKIVSPKVAKKPHKMQTSAKKKEKKK